MSRVVIAEREPAACRRLEKVLTRAKFEVETVSSGPALLEKVENDWPDLVLVDVVMPQTGGPPILERLRELNHRIPVLLMTAKGDAPSTVPKALELEATDYITKPVDAAELLLRVQGMLAKAQVLTRLHVPLRDLHDPVSGRIDAKKVAEYLDVPLAQLAETLGANYATVHKTPDAPALQDALASVKRAIDQVSLISRNLAEVRAWLNNPHPDLGGMTPLKAIMTGRAGAVVTLLENALAGIPT
jgi:DNA-binding response OmpR family regulator